MLHHNILKPLLLSLALSSSAFANLKDDSDITVTSEKTFTVAGGPVTVTSEVIVEVCSGDEGPGPAPTPKPDGNSCDCTISTVTVRDSCDVQTVTEKVIETVTETCDTQTITISPEPRTKTITTSVTVTTTAPASISSNSDSISSSFTPYSNSSISSSRTRTSSSSSAAASCRPLATPFELKVSVNSEEAYASLEGFLTSPFDPSVVNSQIRQFLGPYSPYVAPMFWNDSASALYARNNRIASIPPVLYLTIDSASKAVGWSTWEVNQQNSQIPCHTECINGQWMLVYGPFNSTSPGLNFYSCDGKVFTEPQPGLTCSSFNILPVDVVIPSISSSITPTSSSSSIRSSSSSIRSSSSSIVSSSSSISPSSSIRSSTSSISSSSSVSSSSSRVSSSSSVSPSPTINPNCLKIPARFHLEVENDTKPPDAVFANDFVLTFRILRAGDYTDDTLLYDIGSSLFDLRLEPVFFQWEDQYFYSPENDVDSVPKQNYFVLNTEGHIGLTPKAHISSYAPNLLIPYCDPVAGIWYMNNTNQNNIFYHCGSTHLLRLNSEDEGCYAFNLILQEEQPSN